MRAGPFMRLGFVMAVLPALVLSGCVGSPGKIRKVDAPSEKELRSNWKNYHTYCLKSGYGVSWTGSAILFQVKGGKTIQKSADWQEVSDEKTALRCADFLRIPSPVMSLLGENDATFGYLIYEYRDAVSTAVIDANTISLYYIAFPKTGGP